MLALNFVLITIVTKNAYIFFFTYCPTYHHDLCDVPLVVRVPQFEKLGLSPLCNVTLRAIVDPDQLTRMHRDHQPGNTAAKMANMGTLHEWRINGSSAIESSKSFITKQPQITKFKTEGFVNFPMGNFKFGGKCCSIHDQ